MTTTRRPNRHRYPDSMLALAIVMACATTSSDDVEATREGKAEATARFEALQTTTKQAPSAEERMQLRRAELAEAASHAGDGPSQRAYYEQLRAQLLSDPKALADGQAVIRQNLAEGRGYTPDQAQAQAAQEVSR